MMARRLALGLGLAFVLAFAFAVRALTTYVDPPVDPAWALEGDRAIPDGAVTVRFSGTSTLLFSDGETQWMVDGWFTRVGPIQFVLGKIEPKMSAITRGLQRNEVSRLAMVVPAHSHYDHAMDAPEVAKRTGAILLGSESTANIGRGWGLPESQIRVAIDREPMQFGRFRVTLIETRHFEFPDPELAERALADPEIRAPLVPPVRALDYRLGKPYAIYVEHPRGRWLIQSSAGYEAGALSGYEADVVFLGIGGLGTQTADYREQYWRETVERSGARRVILIHWDSLMGPAEGPFTGELRAAGFLAGGSDAMLEFLRAKQAADPDLVLSTLPRFDEVVVLDRDRTANLTFPSRPNEGS